MFTILMVIKIFTFQLRLVMVFHFLVLNYGLISRNVWNCFCIWSQWKLCCEYEFW